MGRNLPATEEVGLMTKAGHRAIAVLCGFMAIVTLAIAISAPPVKTGSTDHRALSTTGGVDPDCTFETSGGE